MGVVTRESSKAALISYVGVALGALNLIYLMPIILEPGQIGLIRVVLDSAFILATYSKIGVPASAIKFYPYLKERGNKTGILGLMLFSMAVGFFIVSTLVLIFQTQLLSGFQERSPEFIGYLNHVLLITFLYTFILGAQTYCNLLLKVGFQKFVHEVVLRIGVTIPILLYFFDVISFEFVIPIIALFYALALILLFIYLWTLGALQFGLSFSELDKNMVSSIWIFAGFAIIGSGGNAIAMKIDTLMLSSMKGLSDVGVYSIAFFMGTIMIMPKRSVISISGPLISQFFKDKKLNEIQKIYSKSSSNLMLIGGIIGLLVWCNVNDIFSLLPHSEIYSKGKYVVLFVILAKFIEMGMGLSTEIISNSSFYKWNVFIMPFFVIMVVISNFLLIPSFGISGAAMATFIAIFFNNILKFSVVKRNLGIHPFSVKTVDVFIVLILSYLAGYYSLFDFGIPLIDITLRSMQVGIVFLGSIFLFRPSVEIEGAIQKILRLTQKN